MFYSYARLYSFAYPLLIGRVCLMQMSAGEVGCSVLYRSQHLCSISSLTAIDARSAVFSYLSAHTVLNTLEAMQVHI